MPALRRNLPAPLSAGLALLLVLPLTACGDDVDPQPSGPAPAVVQPSLPGVASAVRQDGVPQLVNLTFVDGVVAGVGSAVQVRRGSPVRLTVTSDKADVLLVTGYGLRTQLTVDDPVQVVFIADRSGGFDVVLEATGKVLTRLEVD